MTAILIILGLIAIAVGIFGTIYPALPGLGLMFVGAWLLGYAGDYQVFGSGTLIFLAVVAIFGTAMDYVAGALGAKYTGASKTAVWGAFIGGIVGAFFAIPGLLLGPLIGAASGEFIARKDSWQVGKVGIGTFIGFIIGTVAKIGCALTIMLTVLSVWLASFF